MAFQTVLYDVKDGVATLTMNRPEKLNAFNGTMLEELTRALDEIYERADIRVVVLTGAGRAFSAGADFEWFDMEKFAPLMRVIPRRVSHRFFDDLEFLEKPVIAAINGTCAGGGLELALACDLRIAADSARFGLPEVNAGIMPGSGGCCRLIEVVGVGRAKELAMLGELISAQKAEAINLVNMVVPAQELMAKVHEVAASLIKKAPLAVGLVKHIINTARGVDPATGRILERLGGSILVNTEDAREGVRAFKEKRPPRWTGR
jgi:enoyl-CoA hydratase/carnithine racemase